MKRALNTLLFVCLWIGAPARSAPADVPPGIPPDGELAYTIMREGSPIGNLSFIFTRNGPQTEVRVQTRVLVRYLGIVFYRFSHDSLEIWEGGKLVRIESETDDDGKSTKLSAKAEGGALVASINGTPSKLPGVEVPASFWSPTLTSQKALIDPVDGKLMKVNVAQGPEEILSVKGAKRPARRYKITGDFERDIWYDAQGGLVSVRFKARDGSEIAYVLD
jgi:hypothetical protein